MKQTRAHFLLVGHEMDTSSALKLLAVHMQAVRVWGRVVEGEQNVWGERSLGVWGRGTTKALVLRGVA